MLRAHLEGTEPSRAPCTEQEAEWAPAFPEARVLERREFVRGSHDQRRSGDPTTAAVPRQQIARDAPAFVRDDECEHADSRPGGEIA